MDYNDLLEKYHAVQRENHIIKEEIKRLKFQLGIPEQQGIPFDYALNMKVTEQKPLPEMNIADSNEVEILDINNLSNPSEKIKLLNQPTIVEKPIKGWLRLSLEAGMMFMLKGGRARLL
ncbi:MAG TPA: hypothetical protein DDW65_19555 [Firmicutes bacterium]|jgi:hypothetical protein|nr:hypothetical protein [Bacillota bacterium]